jgi:hypothetical protein
MECVRSLGKKNSSGEWCSCCGQINTKLPLTDRTYICQPCGMIKNREKRRHDYYYLLFAKQVADAEASEIYQSV